MVWQSMANPWLDRYWAQMDGKANQGTLNKGFLLKVEWKNL